MWESPECEGAVAAYNSRPLSSQHKWSEGFMEGTNVGILGSADSTVQRD